MDIAHRGKLLSLFAIAEGATGLALLVVPTILLSLLFGTRQVGPEAPVIGRICGAALLAVAATSWDARNDKGRQGTLGLLVGVTLYNCLATIVLAYSALVLELAGILLWPAVFYHATTSLWCLIVTWRTSKAQS
ncbi:hypothetical protein GCM10007874_52900 [Labrys miyagiensis]|uniref:Uncharacterized protein n=1 Tax=Labrys miyagiensis TaxID=346912 RepID=A0ABQ6CVG3_9HYPH|nr:hypothetical protein [Labrys miyagiensis]GLS22272.1 hypothetical protein GCM10007874_52900 [Labrys miyagiensis]